MPKMTPHYWEPTHITDIRSVVVGDAKGQSGKLGKYFRTSGFSFRTKWSI